MLCRDAALEGHAICLCNGIAVTMCSEVQTLLLLQCGLEVSGLADQARLSLLADTALEQRLDEDHLVARNEALDFIFAGIGPQHFGAWEIDVAKKPRSVKHSGNLHICLRRIF